MDGASKRQLFIELASRLQGATANDVHAAALEQGATDTIEAFHNLGRRLTRSGRLAIDDSGSRKVYHAKDDRDGAWIDEDYLQSIVDAEHPMESLAVFREASRQMRSIGADAWRAGADILREVNAQTATFDAVAAYTDDLVDNLEELGRLMADRATRAPDEEQTIKRRCEGRIEMLVAMCRDGLGLSRDAVYIPATPEAGLGRLAEYGRGFVDAGLLRDEIGRRVEDAPLIMSFVAPEADDRMIVAGVDGSTQGGLLSIDGTAGDFAFGDSPQINLNTTTAVLNRKVRRDGVDTDVFLRLPSSPEEIQRAENSYTIMSPMFYPDLSPAEYMHSAWNAMDVLESRAARKALDMWRTPRSNVEVNPADVVIRDGTIVPNDRDPSHFAQADSYGRIVREMIQLSWEMAQKSRDDAHTIAGAVKNSRIRVVGPILNYVVAQHAGTPATTLTSWALDEMNAVADQQLLSRLLSHAHRDPTAWVRSATFMRPFHATTPAFSRYYKRDNAPAREIEDRIRESSGTEVEKRTSDQHGWAEQRIPNPYTQMLDHVWFAGFYATPGVSLGKGQVLPRLETLIVSSTREEGSFPSVVAEHRDRLMTALATTGFSISQDHDMFNGAGSIDFVPTILQKAHETVLGFARDMKVRAGEYLDRLLSREIGARRRQNVRVRPWRQDELREWSRRMNRGDEQGEARRIA